jgi:hypothetical protein
MAKYHSRPSLQYRYEHYDPRIPAFGISAADLQQLQRNLI